MIITNNEVETAAEIMREAALWLHEKGMPLWQTENLTSKKLLAGRTPANFYVGRVDGIAVAAMILQWHDQAFGEDIKSDESGFIHKLSVGRKYAGMGYASQMIEHAEEECKRKGIRCLRLDRAADRPRLCGFYKSNGFRQKERRIVKGFDVAFFEKYF